MFRPRRNSLASRHVACGLAALCATGTVANGAAVAFTPPAWDRPDTIVEAQATRTTYQYWDIFDSPAGPNQPDLPVVNPTGTANAFDAFSVLDPDYDTSVTLSGNLYAGSSPIHMNVVVPNYADAAATSTRFHLQIRTRGTELFDADGIAPFVLDFSSLLINGQSIAALPSFDYEELYRFQNVGPNSYIVERAIDFELPGNAASYTIEWLTTRGSNSQDEISVDTMAVVPEPAATVVASTSAAWAMIIRRRRPVGGESRA